MVYLKDVSMSDHNTSTDQVFPGKILILDHTIQSPKIQKNIRLNYSRYYDKFRTKSENKVTGINTIMIRVTFYKGCLKKTSRFVFFNF